MNANLTKPDEMTFELYENHCNNIHIQYIIVLNNIQFWTNLDLWLLELTRRSTVSREKKTGIFWSQEWKYAWTLWKVSWGGLSMCNTIKWSHYSEGMPLAQAFISFPWYSALRILEFIHHVGVREG